MENLTLSDISLTLIFITSLIGSILAILKYIKIALDKQLAPLVSSIKQIDASQCKNYLVRFLADVERNTKISEVELERAYDAYQHYTNDLKQNSYIHSKWNKIMGEKYEK